MFRRRGDGCSWEDDATAFPRFDYAGTIAANFDGISNSAGICMPLFELNEPTTVAETIDAEAVVINLERGIYFSIRGLALAIWTNLLAGVPDTLIADSVRARHPGEARRVETDLAQFIDRLIEEGLIRRSARAANGSAVDLAFVPDGSYESPEIEKFTDMEALLLLDPIHDVDDTGWPSRQ